MRLAAGCLAATMLSVAGSGSAAAFDEAGEAELGFSRERFRAPQLKTPPKGTPINVIADKIVYNQKTGIAVASGRVRIRYGSYVLNANRVVYNTKTDQIDPQGEVRLTEPNGNVMEANVAQLQNRFRDGFARHLRLLLTNDSTLTADYAERSEGYLTIYDRVTYTRCKYCIFKDGTPLWQIKSRKVTHNEDDMRIYHEDATMEFAGTPVFWTPYFSHPDPQAKKASGFLTPAFQISDEFGFGVEIPYFWNLAPHYDITFRPVITSEQGVLGRAIWRHRPNGRGEYFVDGAGIYQLNPDDLAAPGDVRWRGWLHTRGEFDINANWVWGWDGKLFSDRTFARKYKLNSETDVVDVAYVTGADDRNYFTARAYHFEGLLSTDVKDAFPTMAPYIRHNYVLNNTVFGGVLGFNTYVDSIHRERSWVPFTTVRQGTDQTRFSLDVDWRRKIIGSMGTEITPFANVRGDLYITDNLPDPTVPGGFRDEEVTTRVLPKAGVDIRWPFIRQDALGQHVFTPVVQFITASNETNLQNIGNEDAVTLNFDHSSIFLEDRFTGNDRFEGGTRANVGFLYNILFPNGGFARVSLGESFHIAGRNSFVSGAGLENDVSDLVGAIALQPFPHLRLTYQIRLDESDFDIHSQELGAVFEFWRLSGNVNYVDVEAEPNYGRLVDQKQLWAAGELRLNGGWSVFGGVRYDFEDDRPVQNFVGLGYDCDCFNFKLYYFENFTSDGDIEADQRFVVSIDFKTLGSTSIGSTFNRIDR